MALNYIITPQGNFINLQDGTRPSLATDVITWANSVGTVKAETYANNAQAAWLFSLITKVIASNLNVNPDLSTLSLLYGATSGWTSVNPTTASVGGLGAFFYLIGFGFATLGITNLKFDDGAGNVNAWHAFHVDADTQIAGSSSTTVPFVATTYTVYYSIDSGSTWVSTGLTMTAS